MIPEECRMTDLSDLAPLKNDLILISTLLGDRGLTKIEAASRKNFVRLVDKAIIEYQRARGSILAQIEEGKRPVEEMKKQGRILLVDP